MAAAFGLARSKIPEEQPQILRLRPLHGLRSGWPRLGESQKPMRTRISI